MKPRFKWRRLLTNPTTHVDAQEGNVTRLRIDGLVCSSVCAVRAREALEGLEGVRTVQVDFEAGVARIEGKPHAAAAYERALNAAVAGKPLRRLLERIDRFVRAARDVGPRTARGAEDTRP
jgi:hypothetical protein